MQQLKKRLLKVRITYVSKGIKPRGFVFTANDKGDGTYNINWEYATKYRKWTEDERTHWIEHISYFFRYYDFNRWKKRNIQSDQSRYPEEAYITYQYEGEEENQIHITRFDGSPWKDLVGSIKMEEYLRYKF